MTTTINSTAEGILFQVDGIDRTQFLASASGSSSALADNGIILQTCEFKLKKPANNHGDTLELDNRYTGLWEKGIQVACRRPSTLIPFPVCGNQYIETASYDGAARELTLQTGCILSLLNAAVPANIGVCIDINNGTSIANAIKTLLLAAGVPAPQIGTSIDGIEGTIKGNVYIQSFQSLIAVAGQMTDANGRVLWQDAAGTVQAVNMAEVEEGNRIPIKTYPLYSLLRYTRRASPQRVPDRLRIQGTELVQPLVLEGSNFRIAGPDYYFDNYTNFYSTSWNRAARTSYTYEGTRGVLREAAPEAYPSYGGRTLTLKTTFERYEQPTFDSFEESNCLPVDEGRILLRVSREQEWEGVALSGYWATRLAYENARAASADDKKVLADIVPFNRPVVRQVNEFWTYNLPPVLQDITEQQLAITDLLSDLAVPGESSGKYSVVHRVDTFESRGILFPGFGDPTLGRENTFIPSNYKSLVLVERVIKRYNLAADRETWTQQVYHAVANYKVNPEAINAAIDDGNFTTSGLLSSISSLVSVPTAEGPRTGAPNFARFPPEEQAKPKNYEIRLNFNPTAQFPINKNVSVTEYAEDRQTAARTAFIKAKLDYSRSKMANCTVPMIDSPPEVRPLSRVAVYDSVRRATEYQLVDACAFAFERTQGAVFTWAGLYQGSQFINPEAPVLTPTYPGQEELYWVVSADGLTIESRNSRGESVILTSAVPYVITPTGPGP